MPEKAEASRMESLAEDDIRRDMPHVEAVYLVSVFIAVGMCSSGGMGVTPISWHDLNAYCERTSTELDAWESEQVMMMSRTYTSSLRRSTDPIMPAPYTREETEDEVQARRNALIEQMERMFDRD